MVSSLELAVHKFAEWRSVRRSRREQIPEYLMRAAYEAAKEVGSGPARKALGLSGSKFMLYDCQHRPRSYLKSKVTTEKLSVTKVESVAVESLASLEFLFSNGTKLCVHERGSAMLEVLRVSLAQLVGPLC